MRQRTSTIANRITPVFFLLIALLAFGLLIPWLGFYWDDWAKILVSRLYGLGGYPAYYAEDRPLSAWTHMLFTPLLGIIPLAWQIFALLLRWLSACLMWWSLSLLWPAARRHNLAAVVLFLVYPVFLQQSAAVTFHQQWLQFALFFFSLGAMIMAQRCWAGVANRRGFVLWTSMSLSASVLQLSVTEYFAPLELIRPFVLWFFPWSAEGHEKNEAKSHALVRRRLGHTLKAWAPYLLILGGYTIYRLFIQRFPGEDPYRADTLYQLFSNPVATLKNLALVVLIDELRILLQSWGDLGTIQWMNAPPAVLASYAVGLVAGGLTVFYALVIEKPGQSISPGGASADLQTEAWLKQSLVIGLAAVLLGPVPAWITGRQVVFDFHSDRYALPAMFGAALLVSAWIGWLSKGRVQRAVLLGGLVMLAVGLHFRTANDYRWIWTDQMRTFWQLTWRASGLKPQTAVIFETEPYPNQGLFSTSAALNLLYSQPKKADPAVLDLYYWVYTLRPRYSHAPDSPVVNLSTRFRTLSFKGATPASLIVYKQPGSCLWVLTPQDGLHPDLPEVVKAWLPLSNLDQILTTGEGVAKPPSDLFGQEPAHEWCYYYQKTALAVQLADWETTVRLTDEASAMGYQPSNPISAEPYEWIPAITALAYTGRWEQAAQITIQAFEQDPDYAQLLCSVWQERLPQGLDPQEGLSFLQNVRQALACSSPD